MRTLGWSRQLKNRAQFVAILAESSLTVLSLSGFLYHTNSFRGDGPSSAFFSGHRPANLFAA